MTTSNWSTLPYDASDDRPWTRLTASETRRLYELCGPKCFIVAPPADATDASIRKNPKKYLKFPVCRPPSPDAGGRTCAISKSGVLAARRRAILTRAKVGSRYEDVVKSTTNFINANHLTLKSRAKWPIDRIIMRTKPHLHVQITYKNGHRYTSSKASPATVMRLYGKHLSDAQKHKLTILAGSL